MSGSNIFAVIDAWLERMRNSIDCSDDNLLVSPYSISMENLDFLYEKVIADNRNGYFRQFSERNTFHYKCKAQEKSNEAMEIDYYDRA